MDILSYLSELLQTRKFVGIAGLGTLHKKKVPGRYDAATHSFVPPSYTLQFTTEIKEDIILADYISKKRNVSADTANYFINEFSEGLVRELDDHKKVNLGDLGNLVKKDGEFIFEPAEKLSYGFDFYGLPSITADKESPQPVVPEQDQNEIPADEIIIETPVVDEPIPEEPFIEEIADEPITAEPLVEEIADEPVPEEPFIEKTADEPITAEPFIEEIAREGEVEEEILPEPAEQPTLESVIAENEITEANPGDQENKIETPEATIVKDEQQLRAEIDALNFYRSKTPLDKPTTEEHEEVIWHLNINNPKTSPEAEITDEIHEPVYPIAEAEEHKITPLYLKVILGLLILVILLAAAYFVKPEWFNGITGKTATPVQQKSNPAPVVPTKDATDYATANGPVNDTLSAVKPVTDTTANKAALIKAPADSLVTYEVIGASMHDQKEADGFIAQMKKSGINAKVVTNMSGKRLKMSIATLKDEESARKELERLSKKLKIEGIYIYRNKQ